MCVSTRAAQGVKGIGILVFRVFYRIVRWPNLQDLPVALLTAARSEAAARLGCSALETNGGRGDRVRRTEE